MKEKLSFAFFSLIIICSFAPAVVACTDNALKERYHQVDTIVIHDTLYNNYKDIKHLRDSLSYIKRQVKVIEEDIRNIDAFEMSPEKIDRSLSRIRQQASSLRKYCGDKRQLGEINKYDEGYEDGYYDADNQQD